MSFLARTPAQWTDFVMAHLDGKKSPLGFWGLPLLIASILLLGMNQPIACSREHPMDHEHGGMSMVMEKPQSPAAQAKLLADKRESEFNHHLAGFFVLLAGIFIFFEERLKNRWPGVRYAWPLCFLLSGIFVLIFSDTELWPFGPKSWWTGVVGNLEVLQHKTFAVILLALGVIEMGRARGVLRAAWSAWVFPVLAFAGSVLLLFHVHGAGTHGPDAMNTMERIQMQHFSYAAAGVGIALSKGLSDAPFQGRRIFRVLWPLCMIALGVLLMLYVE
jgi:putative copper resistance protein D